MTKCKLVTTRVCLLINLCPLRAKWSNPGKAVNWSSSPLRFPVIQNNPAKLTNDIKKGLRWNFFVSSQLFLNNLLKFDKFGLVLKYGFNKLLGYSFIKKLLLLGFFLSAMFVTYAVSNMLGVTNIKDSSFVTINKNYLMIENNTNDEYKQNKSILLINCTYFVDELIYIKY